MKMNSPLVTIAIPAYKAIHLKAAIDSAISQEYKHTEIIIVNDASPFNIDSIVHTYRDPRIQYYKNKVNLGRKSIVCNWNRCLELANGEYFVLLCDDDILEPTMVSEMLKLAQKYPECGCFHAQKTNLHENGEKEEIETWPEYESYKEFRDNTYAGIRHHTITEFFYRTQFLRKTKYLEFSAGWKADDATILLLCYLQNKMISSKKCLITFRKGNDHVTGNNKYAYQRAKGVLDFYHWANKNSFLGFPISRQGMESMLFDEFKKCSFIDKIRLLPYFSLTTNNIKMLAYSCVCIKQ